MKYTGKLTASKASSNIAEIMAVLEIYSQKKTYLSNKDLCVEYRKIFMGKNNDSQITNLAQPLGELNFIEYENPANPQSEKRITNSGSELLKAYKKVDSKKVMELWLEAISLVSTGVNNPGNPSSCSPIERLAVFINATQEPGQINNYEYAFILQGMCNSNNNKLSAQQMVDSYREMIDVVKKKRKDNNPITSDDIYPDFNKFVDDKDVDLLKIIGVLEEV